jgi:periplasmic protein TonB
VAFFVLRPTSRLAYSVQTDFIEDIVLHTAHLHEGLEFPEFSEAVDDHGCGWLDQRALWCHRRLLQSIILSFSFHLAILGFLFFMPKSTTNGRNPYIEVSLVSLGTGEVAPGLEGGGGSVGQPAVASLAPEGAPSMEAAPPEKKQEATEKPKEKQVTPSVNQAPAQPRPVKKPKEPAKSNALEQESSSTETSSQLASQPACDPVESLSGNAGALQGGVEPGEGGSGAAGVARGKGLNAGHGGGPVDAEFGAANGPRFARKIMPSYPRLARQLGKEAVVVVRVTIDERGHPIAVEALKTAGSGFDEEAIRAVKESLFHPAKREGIPVTCRAILPIRFELRGVE